MTAAGSDPVIGAAERLVEFCDRLLDTRLEGRIRQVNPRVMAQRGCQFALEVTAPGVDGRAVFEALEASGVACDWRYPNVIRVAPTPLYTRFVDVYDFVERLERLLDEAAV